ncbi:MAG: T9SS type A sorting domain-containing protein [Candidatus Coatesbacteria bacterium]|nr:MAG: T9SS type A sorting domain-containing protein [Candidatus Coatesbacteria bacterium]
MRWLALIGLILVLCVSAAPYPISIIASYSSAPFSAAVADMNNDGGNDVITVAKNGGENTIYFFENKPTTGYGQSWEEYEVAVVGHDYYLYAADLDGANYLDIVHSGGGGYLNGGLGDSWTLFSINTDITIKETVDISRDGYDDVIYEESNTGGWYENSGDGSNWTAHAGTFAHTPITSLEVEGDHDWDVLTFIDNFGAPDHFYVAENVDGFGGSWNEYEINIINDDINASRGVAVLDADGNSTADICVAVVAATAGDVLTLSIDAGVSTTTVDEGTAYSTVLSGDFDGDDSNEIVAYDFAAKTAYMFDNLMTSPLKTELRADFIPFCAGDVNDDGADDVIGYSIADGALAYAFRNAAPSAFNLLSPPDGETVNEPVMLDWEDAEDVQQVTYDLWYSTDPTFATYYAVTGLIDSAYTYPDGTLTAGATYYWKVAATDGYEETWSGPDEYWSFTVHDPTSGIDVKSFSAESVRDGVEVSWECTDEIAGFNLYRSTGAGKGETVTFRDKLNAELITGESPYEYLDEVVEEGTTYAYRLEAIDVSGSSETFGPVECTWNGVLPITYALYQSRPNPATGAATIAFDLREGAEVTLTVYDISGRKVTTLVDETLVVGTHERVVSGLVPGVYVYKLEAGEFKAARKMVIVE